MVNWIGAACALGAFALAGCGGGSHAPAAAAAARHSVAPVPATRASGSLRCGRRPAYGRALLASGGNVVMLPGSPDGIAASTDGRFAFVAIQSGPPRIAVIERGRLLRTVAIPAQASGVRVTPDRRYLLAAAGRGAIVLDVARATSGAAGAVLGWLLAPAPVAGSGPGAAEVAVSPDSRYAFVTLEGTGVVAVFDLRRGFGPRAFVGAVPVGAGALGLAISSDGRWLYEVSESGHSSASRRRGVLNVIDAARALRTPRSAVVGAAPAPCAPVRVAVSPDAETVWVTARDGNQLLGFSARALRTDPARALLSATSVGSAPLGLAVADGGRTVLVADSNLASAPGSRSAVSVVNVSAVGRPILTGSATVGKLADAIAVPSSGGVAFVTSSASRTASVIPLTGLR